MVSRKAKLRIEAPVNGGRNYKNRTLRVELDSASRYCSYVNKLGYMLENPVSIRCYSLTQISSDNALGADNQQERRPSESKDFKNTNRYWILSGGFY